MRRHADKVLVKHIKTVTKENVKDKKYWHGKRDARVYDLDKEIKLA